MIADNKIEGLLKDFFNISKIRVSIHDTTLRELYSYPTALSPFCSCVQSIPQMREECLKSDTLAFSIVEKTNEPYIYRCQCGLYEAVAPIYNYGKLTGYLMLGQIRDENTQQINKTKSYLIEKGLDGDLVNNAYESIICIEEDVLNSYINIMTVLAEHITKTNKLAPAKNTLPFLIRKELISNFRENITLSHLSKKFNCSIGTITTAFKNEYHTSIHSFLINIRLNNAVELLKSSDKSIKEISELCGFCDQNHFYRTFKSNYNTSPIEYRRINKA